MLDINQASVGATAVTAICTVPPGPCMVALSSDPASTGTVYVGITPAGTANTLSGSNGMPLAAGQSITFAGYKGSAGASLSGWCKSGSAATVGYLISTGF